MTGEECSRGVGMFVPLPPSTTGDIAQIERRLERIERLLERLTSPITAAIREGHYGPEMQAALEASDEP